MVGNQDRLGVLLFKSGTGFKIKTLLITSPVTASLKFNWLSICGQSMRPSTAPVILVIQTGLALEELSGQ